MAIPDLPPPTTVPSRTQSAEAFNTNVAAFLAWMAQYAGELPEWALALIQTAAAANYSATSSTSLTIGEGQKLLTVETGKMFVAGQDIVIADAAAPETNRMYAIVSAYDLETGEMTVEAFDPAGTGTFSAWLIGLSGAKGRTGDPDTNTAYFLSVTS